MKPVAPYSESELSEIFGNRHSKSKTAALIRRYIQVTDRDGPHCDLCKSGRPYEFDHIVPKTEGGGDDLGNFCLAHEFCNKYKGSEDHSTAQKLIAELRQQARASGQPWPPEGWWAREVLRERYAVSPPQ